MAEKTEKKTKSEKVNGFLDKNRKVLLIIFIILIVGLIGYVVFDSVSTKAASKNIAKIESISYELTSNSSSLSGTELVAKEKETLAALEEFTKKSGVAGVRANMLCAEINYKNKEYKAAIDYWTAAANKDKSAYTAPICNYQLGVCYEQINDLDNALVSYKKAAETKYFPLASHALFSYARVLETKGEYAEAVESYEIICTAFDDDVWASVAKSRILSLQIQGKVE